ncbi:MAG: Hsp20/alpha crystallin family protein [Deltaproteobacteria bacterium]|nr:Hsp20/alpha crystallin family protein [Deltaproteobacteria bacterium]
MAEETRITPREKREMAKAAETTRPGPVFTPEVDIYEKDNEIVLVADMPGVTAGKLTVDLNKDILTIDGEAEAPKGEGETELLREFAAGGRYTRQFTVSDVIDRDKITATLKNGVMRLTLPKVAKAQPRKIEVKEA